MLKYRAVKEVGSVWWEIEEHDTENQVVSKVQDKFADFRDAITNLHFSTQKEAEEFIQYHLIPQKREEGKWFNGPI